MRLPEQVGALRPVRINTGSITDFEAASHWRPTECIDFFTQWFAPSGLAQLRRSDGFNREEGAFNAGDVLRRHCAMITTESENPAAAADRIFHQPIGWD